MNADRPAANADVVLRRGFELRAAGRIEEALVAVEAALALDPTHFLALLSKAALLERTRGARAAARVYADALKLAPAPANLPETLRASIERAKAAVAADRAELHAHLRRAVGDRSERFAEAMAIYAGEARAFVQEPLLLHYPRLPAIPFHDRQAFPWLAELEAATPAIVAECERVVTGAADHFAPYVEFPPGAPVNQWAALNHSRDWSTFYLWRDGVRLQAACDRCPQTSELLDRLPMLQQPGFGPTAMFSALAARTTIPPHTGSSNARLTVHLPLLVPGPARFRVGNVTREWRVGEAWVFDDTIEHEAWNDADAGRVILIFDVWNPELSASERVAITAMMRARVEYYAGC